MGQIAVVIIDAAEIRSYDCLLPDDVQISQLASGLAEAIGFQTLGTDDSLINYSLIVKRGKALDPHKTLQELDLYEPLELRLVPEVTANQDDTIDELIAEDAAVSDEPAPVQIEILGVNNLIDDVGVGLRTDVRIDAGIHREIEEYAGQDRNKEFAGLLLGSVEIEYNVKVIHVTAMIPALGAISTRSEVRITGDAWESMLKVRDEQYNELRILGWFHSHSGWGVFLSDADMFIHTHFFAHRDMAAYVVDLTSGRDGFFIWQGKNIALCPSFGIVVAQDEADCYKQNKPQKKLPLVRNCIIALLLVLGIMFGVNKLPELINRPEKTQNNITSVTPVVNEKIIDKADRIYTIGECDNLWDVCKEFYGDGKLAGKLARYNGLTDFSALQVGQDIKLPPQEVLEEMADN